MNDNPEISVIIPIYNVDSYLYRCLASVACQTFRDFEVIMIDDGSTDSSLLIAQDFAASFYNFHLVKNKVKGVSGARNMGVKKARGEYIAFVDSDDYVDPSFLKTCTAPQRTAAPTFRAATMLCIIRTEVRIIPLCSVNRLRAFTAQSN